MATNLCSKSMQRFSRYANELVATYSLNVSTSAFTVAEDVVIDDVIVLQDSLVAALNDYSSTYRRLTSGADSEKKAACARSWLSAHFQCGLLETVEALLWMVRGLGDLAAAAPSASTPATRCVSSPLLFFYGFRNGA